jgi:putative hemolysin
MAQRWSSWFHSPMKRSNAWVAAFFLAACSAPAPQPQTVTAASAAQHCESQGGQRRVESGADGEIGVCSFQGDRQCEEWALLLGECPSGGIPVAGYATTSERHCAIRGGRMTIPGCALSPTGVYEASNVLLVLQAGRGRAAMLRQTGNVMPGTWQGSGNVVTVITERERLVFDYAGDRLIPREWDRALWGAHGPGTLLRQR